MPAAQRKMSLLPFLFLFLFASYSTSLSLSVSLSHTFPLLNSLAFPLCRFSVLGRRLGFRFASSDCQKGCVLLGDPHYAAPCARVPLYACLSPFFPSRFLHITHFELYVCVCVCFFFRSTSIQQWVFEEVERRVCFREIFLAVWDRLARMVSLSPMAVR